MKLCMMSCMAGFNSPREVVEIARYCDMPAVDWIYRDHDMIDAKFHRKLSVDNGLYVAGYTLILSAFIKGQSDWQDVFKRELEKACILEAPVMMIPPFAMADQKSFADDQRRWTEFYAWATPLAQAAGVQLTLESTGYLKSPISTAAEVLDILNAVPELRLTLDYGNMATSGETPETLPQLCDKIVHIHLKDWLISDTKLPDHELKRCGKYFANALIGTGNVDLKASWDVLSAANKECFVNLETADATGKLPLKDAMKQVADALRNW